MKAQRSFSTAFSFDTKSISLYKAFNTAQWLPSFITYLSSGQNLSGREKSSFIESLSFGKKMVLYSINLAAVLVTIVSPILIPPAWGLRAIYRLSMGTGYTLGGLTKAIFRAISRAKWHSKTKPDKIVIHQNALILKALNQDLSLWTFQSNQQGHTEIYHHENPTICLSAKDSITETDPVLALLVLRCVNRIIANAADVDFVISEAELHFVNKRSQELFIESFQKEYKNDPLPLKKSTKMILFLI